MQAVRVAELQVAGFTGLAAPTDVVEVRPVRRAGGVLANVDGLRGLLEPAAARMGEALGRAMAEGMPAEMGPMGGLVTQLGPLLQGTQVGQVLAGSSPNGCSVSTTSRCRATRTVARCCSSCRTSPRSSAIGRSTRSSSGRTSRCTR